MLLCLILWGGISSAWATTVTKTISDVVSENSYTVSSGSTINTKCTSIDLDANINVSVAVKDGATGNTGTFWGTSPNIDWRLYQADEPTITVSAADGYTISTVKFTYSNSNTGVINTSGHGQSIGSTNQITSGNAYTVNAVSATYYVGNSSTKSNGQARITAIEVVYSNNSGGNQDPAPTEFASLEDLVAADLTSGTNVTVSFENVPIKAFQTVSGTRKGVYFDIQKGGNDIEIYFNSAIPAEWAVNGTLSGTFTNCPWKLYNDTWELAPASGWAWTNLTYKAPANYAPEITTQPVDATYEFNASATNLTVAASGNPAPTYQWYSNTTNSNENGTVLTGETKTSYKPSTATAGTFYYYCVATNSEGSAASDVATITVNEPAVASLPFSFDGGKNDIASTDGMSQSGLGTDYTSSPKLKFDSQGDNVIINFNEAAKKVTYTIKGNSTSGTYAFDVMESADGVNYTTVHSHTSITDASYTDNLKAESRFVKFVYTTKDNGNVALGKISIVAASVLDDPELAFAQPTYIFFTDDDMQVVATSSAGSTGAISYALTDGDADAFLIDESTGDIVCETAGTYTVTATIAAITGFSSGTATCTVKIKEPIVGNTIIVAETDGGCYAMTTTCEGSYFGSIAIKKAGDKYVVESLDDILFYTNTADGKTTIQSTSNAQYVQATAAKNISYTENEYKWTKDGEKLTAATASYGTLQYNTSSPRFTTYGSKVGQYATIVDLSNVIVGEIVTLNSACTDENFVYGTYSSSKAWVVPSDLEVSEISIVDDALYVESYASGAVVPANTGVMVSAEDGGSYAVAFSNEAGTSVLGTENCLHPSSEPMTGDNLFYRLTMHNGTQIGFWWGAEDGAAFSLAANKAYLAVPKSSSARTGLWFGDDEEALEAVEMNDATTIYTLDGVKVNELQKGLNIVNGKKVMVK